MGRAASGEALPSSSQAGLRTQRQTGTSPAEADQEGMGRDLEGMAGQAGGARRRKTAATRQAARPQHACFPGPAHESRDDSSLISDAKSQELRADAGTTSAPASTWRAAIKHGSKVWNAKCLKLGRAHKASHSLSLLAKRTGQGWWADRRGGRTGVQWRHRQGSSRGGPKGWVI